MMNMIREEEALTFRPRPALVEWGVGCDIERVRHWKCNFTVERDYRPDLHLVASDYIDYGNRFLLRQVNSDGSTGEYSVHPDGCQVVPSSPSGVCNQSILLYIKTEANQDDQRGFIQTQKHQPQRGWHFVNERFDRDSLILTNCLKVHEENAILKSTPVSEVILNFPVITIPSSPTLIVGCALKAKKVKSFLKPALIASARSKGIIISTIDYNQPLLGQGRFDVILHKISEDGWHAQLKAYKKFNPMARIFDPPNAIMKVYNRKSMLKEVADLKFQHSQGKVRVPRQVVVEADSTNLLQEVTRENLKFPLVAKPLWIDGSAKSHALSIVFNEGGLSSLRTPVVLQEFVYHGGVMFKVFVVGHLTKVVHRASLPDACVNDAGGCLMPFPRISSAAALAVEGNEKLGMIDYPPNDMLSSLAKKLSSRLGLRLFNFDLIRESGSNGRYYVIDINYFPGYGKVPEYEAMFTEFFLSIAREKFK